MMVIIKYTTTPAKAGVWPAADRRHMTHETHACSACKQNYGRKAARACQAPAFAGVERMGNDC
jgi:hypothetical protein